MGSLHTAKILGGIGALLSLIGSLITASAGILSLIGFILVFIAVKMIADEVKEKAIFDNYLYAFIVCIIAFITFIGIIFITFASIGGLSFITELQNTAITEPTEIWNSIQPVLGGAIAGLIVFWILAVVATFFLRKSFNLIAEKTGVKWFAKTGLLYFVGTITTIVLVGFIILFIAMILEIVAFFSLPDKISAMQG